MASALAKFDGSSTDNSAITSTSYGLPRLSPSPVFRIPSPPRIAFPESPGQRILKSPMELDNGHGKSPKSRQASGSPSGGSDAAIARDALEGMIETLSRTKDSIGRATRHAIECSKYGIAGEVLSLTYAICITVSLLFHYPYCFSSRLSSFSYRNWRTSIICIAELTSFFLWIP
jgi:hypothetical protein